MKGKSLQEPRNTEALQRHKREYFWQIIFPLIICAGIVVGLAVWVGVAASDLRQPADASMILLSIPVIIIALLVFLSLVALLFLVVWLNKNLPFYTKKVYDWIVIVQHYVRRFSDAVVEPFIRLRGYGAMLGKLFGK